MAVRLFMRKSNSALFGLLALLLSNGTLAHSEHDKARFVSPTGKDIGQCDNVLRPCNSIAFAVKQANKGDRILLASGQYEISSSDDLFYLQSALVPILGGYNRFDHYQSQSPATNVTTLTNVPLEMAEALRKKGFRVLADGKSLAKNTALSKKLSDYHRLSQRQQDVVCQDGMADVFECSNVDLLSHLPLTQMSSRPGAGNDIWGHVDLNNNREYAIMGVQNGTIIVDVTEPTNPVEVGTIDGVSSSWRDVKVYQYFNQELKVWQAYAYVTTEGTNSGATDFVTIIDLNSLPNSVSLVDKSNVVRTAHNVYISNVDYSLNIALPEKEPVLQLVGTNDKSGAFQSYSLSYPPTLTPGSNQYYGSGYTHDGASLSINDARAQESCGISEGSCTVFIDFNEKEMKLWDITDPNQSKQLSSTTYNDVPSNNQYIHSGWGTDDNQFVLLHDEFDEYRGGLNTTVRIFSIEDLANPIQVGQWTGSTKAIDHNGFVRGNRYYMSNYERGLTILDITNAAEPQEVGFFDTYTPTNNASFNGAWGVYPFLPSGTILVSDINSGLYVLKDNAKDSAIGQFSFDNKQIATEQGISLTINVNRDASNLTSETSVSYQVIAGSATAGDDFVLADGQLDWSTNDNSVKTLHADIAAQVEDNELPESFFIRLYKPTNGATLGMNSYTTVNIAGKEDTGAASFALADIEVSEQASEISLQVNRVGSSSGNLTVNYTTTAASALAGIDYEEAAGQISWQDGDNNAKTVAINVIDDQDEESSESFIVTLTSIDDSRLGANAQINVTIADDDQNTAPTVTIGENFQVNADQQVSLTATATDPDNDSMTYLWEQTSGTSVTIANADTTTATFTAPSSASTLIFQLTATDFRGASTSSSVTITVVAPVVVTPPTVSNGGGSGGSIYWLILCLLPISLYRIK